MDSNLNVDARSADSSSTRRPDIAWNLSELDHVRKNGIKVFSTFACGGGSTMGYKLAGCDVIGANDIDPEMAWHYRKNLKPRLYYLCPIRDLLEMKLPDEMFSLDILDGSPPCSTFSMAGSRENAWGKKKHFREGQSEQVLSDLFFDFLDVAERLRPKTIIAENVKGMLMGNAKGYCKQIAERINRIGYRLHLFLINAADCGVPQRRERVFFCAVREDVSASALRISPSHRWISAGEAIADYGRNVLKWKMITASNVRHTIAGRCKPWKMTQPSPTLVSATSKELIGPSNELDTWLLGEAVRLGSFPDDYLFRSARIGKYIIGMSVPPRMMEVVARAVCSQWLGVNYGAT
jgi:DNA (cytosine-5)-methyltransferase 1